MFSVYSSNAIKFFFLMTPFFVISTFLSMTRGADRGARRAYTIRIGMAVLTVSLFLFLFGRVVFDVLGITVDSFRIGAGGLLFLSAVGLVRESGARESAEPVQESIVVPLAIPITVGPATIGAILVSAVERPDLASRVVMGSALVTAVAALTLLLYASVEIERVIGQRGIRILSKITGLVLSAMAAQMIFTGARNFFAAG